MKFAFLKPHQTKSLDRAINVAFQNPDLNEPGNETKLVNEALKIAQLRSHRFWSDGELQEARDYLRASWNL